MEIQVGVKAFLRNSEGKYLLLKRAPSADKGPGKWDIPGGRMEAGASVIDNLKREIMEETALTMTGEPVFFALQDLIWPDARHVVRLLYRGTIEGVPILSHEHTEYKWSTADEIAALSDQVFDRFLVTLVEERIEELR